jgi:membrane-associated protease RseP (regulator of RpoE activity)
MAERPLLFRRLPAPMISPDEAQLLADQVRALIHRDLAIESVQIGRDQAREGVVIVHGRLLRPSAQVFSRWLAELNRRGYTPILRPGGEPDRVVLHVIAGVAPKSPSRVWINIVLFVLTVVSTLFAGMFYGDNGIEANTFLDLLRPSNLLLGAPFALTLLGILAAHEFGHYFAARYHRVAVTLPYFLPMPFGLGTFGAFIQLREPVPDRRKLFDIGVAGPLAGLVLAVPLLFYGLATSPLTMPIPGGMLEGNSIFYYFAKILIFGMPLPNPITGQDVLMNQVTFAAWIGLLVTAFNLLPIGQLDGGHTVFALFGDKARLINRIAFGVLVVLALASLAPLQQIVPQLRYIGYNGWFIWVFLTYFLIGLYHPPALDDVTQLDSRRRWLGYLVIAIFILIFVPVPFTPI